MARPQLDIDAAQVEKLAALGAKVEEIADFFQCSRDTIHGRFSAELRKGRASLRLKLRQWQLKTAEKGNATMQIWLGKQLLDQKDGPSLDSSQGAEESRLTIIMGGDEGQAS